MVPGWSWICSSRPPSARFVVGEAIKKHYHIIIGERVPEVHNLMDGIRGQKPISMSSPVLEEAHKETEQKGLATAQGSDYGYDGYLHSVRDLKRNKQESENKKVNQRQGSRFHGYRVYKSLDSGLIIARCPDHSWLHMTIIGAFLFSRNAVSRRSRRRIR